NEAFLALSSYFQRVSEQARVFLENDDVDLSDDERRQLTLMTKVGTAAQTDKDKVELLTRIETNMTTIYSTAKVCYNLTDSNSTDPCLRLEPELTKLMTSRDPDLLASIWKLWRDNSGRKMREQFTEYVRLSNEAVQIAGYADLGAYWRSAYDTPTFEQDIAALWEQVLPLYQHLHSYVRRKLQQAYPNYTFPPGGHIPAHLLGDMWAQTWGNIGDIVNPFKDKELLDTTKEMIRQNYTVMRMFKMAEEFFYSLGFDNMTDTFWRESMFVRPEGREVSCHASAHDLYRKDDFRRVMCTEVNHEYLMIIHHEMGHIHYCMEYADLPFVYTDGANPGRGGKKQCSSLFLFVSLCLCLSLSLHTDLNFLMSMALTDVAFLPFGYLIDQWRWSVFRGDTPADKYNEDWWKLRCKIQGVSPPVQRTEEDFDPGAKFHVPASYSYDRYFVAFVIQFQFYKAACEAANYTGPLHQCDFYNNKAAGDKIRSMLQLGSSKPWPDAMEKITGQRSMDAGPLLEYFQPLLEFLKKENGDDFGWEDSCPEDLPTGGAA
ncbi:hypothetical protein EGW08_023264, partial [Elysia chlorotica]